MVICRKCGKSADEHEWNIVHIVQENVGTDKAVNHSICTPCLWRYEQETSNKLSVIQTYVGNQILTDVFRGFKSNEEWIEN